MRSIKGLTLLLVVALAAQFALAQDAKPVEAKKVAEKAVAKKAPMAPDFTLKTHDGKSLTLSKLRGKRGALLVFFATWCPSCMTEVPHIKEFVKKSKDAGILVFGVNIKQPKRVVDKFVKDKGVNYRILLDDEGKVAKAFNVTGIPAIFGIDADGLIQFSGHHLPKDERALIKALAPQSIGAENVDLKTLAKWVKSGNKPVVIDARDTEAYSESHIRGAVNIPLDQFKYKKALARVAKDATIVTYCSGPKCKAAHKAAQTLSSLGFSKVYVFSGGLEEWTKAGHPVAKAESAIPVDSAKNKIEDDSSEG
jgi:rhodanese-related sulfurtransferase/peroxiredoxin